MNKKAVVLLSGGMDSSTLLFHMIDEGYKVRALGIGYSQRHRRELDYALRIAQHAEVPFTLAKIDPVLFKDSNSSQVAGGAEVPHGHYADESMKITVVPNRNMLLLAMAGAVAEGWEASTVAYAAHSGDHAIYPDCRPEFADALNHALKLGTYQEVQLYRPFIGMSKAEIVRRGAELGVPFELTYSCYEGQPLHCGKCGTCVERREAFELARVPDPTEYKP